MTDPRKPIFDAVRAAAPAGLFNDPGNILALDNLLDAFGVPHFKREMRASPACVRLLHKWEGCARLLPDGRYQAYPDPGSSDGRPWTIGWGSTGPDIKRGTIWTREQCDARFLADLTKFEADVRKAIGTAPTTQSQFDALVCFHYNTGAIASATLTKLHKAGRYAEAAEQFARWIFNDGKPMDGLKKRRAEEAALYRGEQA